MQRDTDSDWNILGEVDPYFGVLANEHFRGRSLDGDAHGDFFASGVVDLDYIFERIGATIAPGFSPTTAVDFGCGVGRLAIPMAAHAKHVVGVDVAESMLRVARHECAARGLRNITFAESLPPGPVDWVNSFIVFQHIPPARGLDLLGLLIDILAPRGVLTVQVTYFRDARHVHEIHRDLADFVYDGETVRLLSTNTEVAPGSMTMYDYDLNAVFRLLHRRGLDHVFTEPTDHGGCHGIRLFAHRS